MHLQDDQDVPAQINILPMIDVIFAILAFFIMSTLFLTRQEGLPVNLPKASTSQRSQVPTKITVTLDSDGQVSVNKEATAIDTLSKQIQGLIKKDTEAVVIINADEGVNHGRVIAVMDQVRQVKGAKLAIATQKP
ncbi:ExbD/TolR family protein [Calothrix rhizosoleniae]|uniref:ExbD/TolR family protein n=1 Tax=Calothrix rhizosoleniae TaxID=888997 RepID=UPI000B4A0471|nr:biopolymer transporter ExbD [Calothrix rhizosoleniae]